MPQIVQAQPNAAQLPNPVTAVALTSTVGSMTLAVHLHGVDDDRRAPLLKTANEALRNVNGYLQARVTGRLDIDFVGSDDDFAQVMADHHVRGWDERWLAGLALLDQSRIIVHVNGTRALTTRDTLEHELVHVLMHATAGGQRQPRWYQEGAAMLLTGEATWERLRNIAGAAPLGQLDSLDDLDDGLLGSAVAKERAYAMAGGFLQFITRRVNDRNAVAEVQRQMQAGMPFETAFGLFFGRSPDHLYGIYAETMQASASAWSLLLTDNTLWTVLSLFSAIALVRAWQRRPKFSDMPVESPGPPIDLEAVAAAGEVALQRPWRYRDFARNPLIVEPDFAQRDNNDDTDLAQLDSDLHADTDDIAASNWVVQDQNEPESEETAARDDKAGLPVDAGPGTSV